MPPKKRAPPTKRKAPSKRKAPCKRKAPAKRKVPFSPDPAELNSKSIQNTEIQDDTELQIQDCSGSYQEMFRLSQELNLSVDECFSIMISSGL